MDSRQLLREILEAAVVLPRAEIVRALIEPHKALINLIANRSADLAEIEAIADEHLSPNYGIF